MKKVSRKVPKIDLQFLLKSNTIKFISSQPFVLELGDILKANHLGFAYAMYYHATKLQSPHNNEVYGVVADKKISTNFKGSDEVAFKFHVAKPVIDRVEYIFTRSLSFSSVSQFLDDLKPYAEKVGVDIVKNESNVLQLHVNSFPQPLPHNKYNFEKTEGETLRFVGNFHRVLGFMERYQHHLIMDPNTHKFLPIIADYKPMLYQALSHMYVYASIANPIQVGHVRAPLLKTVWIPPAKEFAFCETIHVDFNTLMYVPVSSNSFNSIEVNIRLDSGELVPFIYGSVTSLTLHFKRNRL
jgi:hypothetical protein